MKFVKTAAYCSLFLLPLVSLCGCVASPNQEDNIENTSLSFDDPSQAKPIAPDSFVGHALQMESALEQAENAFPSQPARHETYKSAVLASYTPHVKETPGHVDGIKAIPKISVMASSLDTPEAPVLVGSEPISPLIKPATPRVMQTASHSRKSGIVKEAHNAQAPEVISSGLLKPGM